MVVVVVVVAAVAAAPVVVAAVVLLVLSTKLSPPRTKKTVWAWEPETRFNEEHFASLLPTTKEAKVTENISAKHPKVTELFKNLWKTIL